MSLNKFLILNLLILMGLPALAQSEKKDIREGNKLFRTEKYGDSEIAYRKAVETESSSIPGAFNLGDALYRQEKFEDAGEQFNNVINNNVDKTTKAQAFHNMGNSFLLAGQLEEAIEAYKDALRNKPDDMDTKYNLAYAQNLKKQQEEQEKQDQEQNKDQDKEDKKDQENQDKQDQENQDKKDQQDQQEQDQKDQQQKDQEQNKEEQEQEPQQQEGKISKEDAQRILEALENDEKKVQEKVKKQKAKAKRVRVLKDW